MKSRLDDLVRRQAAILAEIRNLDSAELECFANLPNSELGGDTKASRLLRGLIRSQKFSPRTDLMIHSDKIREGETVPAVPGLFVINLMPLSGGGFDRKRVLKTPVIAWKVDSSGYATPIIPGLSVTDDWAVLTPDGFVIADEYASLSDIYPVELKDWINVEIEWAEEHGDPAYLFSTPSQELLVYRGPLARAVWQMMVTRRNWTGTPEEMLEIISVCCDDAYLTNLPTEPAAMLAGLAELQVVFADAGVFINRSDDGRLIVSRVADEEVEQRSLVPPVQQ